MTKQLIIFDVDRTLIDGTAWPRLLRSENSPLEVSQRAQFDTLDRRRHHRALPPLLEREFRDQVLTLLKPSLGEQPADQLLRWGGVIAHHMSSFSRPFELAKRVRKENPGVQIVYLTAGWEPFMMGLTNVLAKRHGLGGVPSFVVGSTLAQYDGQWRTGILMDGMEKAQWINSRLDEGCQVLLLADDQHHHLLPFDRVKQAGGYAFRLHVTSGVDPWERAILDARAEFGA